ncbi:hypothetical protein NQ315_000001, partial [Exocentrus adspersus]
MYHHISNININAQRQRYGPIYFLDPEASVDQRYDNNQTLDRNLIARLEDLFREINPYARAYMHLRERFNFELQTIERLRNEALMNNEQPLPLQMPEVTLELLRLRGANRREYDLPIVEEVAAVYNIQPDAPATPNMRIYDRLRAAEYVGLADYLQLRIQRANQRQNNDDNEDDIDEEDEEAATLGRMVILPSTFVGSPRHQQQLYQDAMAVVARFGIPSIFLTMTTNTHWPEIVDNIPRGHSAADHPSLIDRVFNCKVQELLDDMLQSQIFGEPVANLNVIEFQKR